MVLEQADRGGRVMQGQTHGGKGSSQRPAEDSKKFASNWDAIFNKTQQKPKDKKKELKK